MSYDDLKVEDIRMTEISGSVDCGNSPKNKLVQDVAIFLETGEGTSDGLHEDVVWSDRGQEPIKGRTAVQREVDSAAKPTSLRVDHAISHGRVGAVNGDATLANGHTRRFCHVIEFTSAAAKAVASIHSYE